MIDPGEVWTKVALALFVVAAFDIGVAFLVRAMREASPESDRDD